MEGRLTSSYQELRPPPVLARYVECLWVQRIGDGGGAYEQPVLPDGCIDVVALGDRIVVAGPATGSTTLRLAPGALNVGVRFRTGAGPALVGVSAAELRDRQVPLDALWNRAAVRIAGRVAETSGWTDRLGVMVEGLVDRLGQARMPDPIGIGIASLLAERPGRALALLAEDVGVSDRQLRRRVQDAVGYPPRTLSRILRFQRFLHAARASRPSGNLAELAADAGYADQAHLTRECRDLGGRPPAALLTWEAERLAG